MADTFTWAHDRGQGSTTTLNISEVQFSDGYIHRSQRSLNPAITTYNLSFVNRKVEDIDAMVSFLKAKGGYIAFIWSSNLCPVPGEDINVICKTWSRSQPVDGIDSLTTTFEVIGYGLQVC